jgi:2-oxoisovalerate dehydrogenase E2 component (dihydrolipoyl transacylase)
VVEGIISKWLKKPGDKIERFEPLVEVVTDKVTMEVPSPVDGSLTRILAQEGETVPMGAPIAEVETSQGAAGPRLADHGLPASPQPQVATASPQPVSSPSTSSGPIPVSSAIAGPPPLASTIGYLAKDVRPVGPTGGGVQDDAATTPEEIATAPPLPRESEEVSPSPRGPVRYSPAVRRLAQEHQVDLALVKGSGLGGRITRDDVLTYIENRQAQPSPAPVTPTPVGPAMRPAPAVAAGIAAPPSPQPAPGADEEYLPLTPVRRMIAEAMVRSVSQIPHAWSTVEVDVTSLVALRNSTRASFTEREGVELTYLPFIIKAVVESLKEHPTLNASWGGDKVILKKRINLGIAVAAPQGLVVPVIHDADHLSIAGLAHAARDLTNRARQNQLSLPDVQGGTFTLNNTGALGSIVSQPIINYPQAAILTTETIQKQVVVRDDDAIAIHSMMNLCISFDHRINDGAQVSAFLQAVKRRLEAMGPETPIY